MSKPVRLPDYLYAEVERLATAERRSTANMVKVLLEQALGHEKLSSAAGFITPQGRDEAAKVMTGKTELLDAMPSSAPREPDPELAKEFTTDATAKPRRKSRELPSEPFSLVCENRANHRPGVHCPVCKGDGSRR